MLDGRISRPHFLGNRPSLSVGRDTPEASYITYRCGGAEILDTNRGKAAVGKLKLASCARAGGVPCRAFSFRFGEGEKDRVSPMIRATRG
jgi:hypothetical protein